jgi:hypothetical protein
VQLHFKTPFGDSGTSNAIKFSTGKNFKVYVIDKIKAIFIKNIQRGNTKSRAR